MKIHKVLITGGAGFIGSFLTDELVGKGYAVTILDNLEDQVHQGRKPSYLNPKAKFIKGDVRNYCLLEKTLTGIDVVFHLASRVGVGQSNYQIKDYVDANIGGTANLIDLIVNKKIPIKKIIIAASMSSYGEGNCRCAKCGIVKPKIRSARQLAKKLWELYCPRCQFQVSPIATNEDTFIQNNSIYALTKNVQENLLLLIGRLYNIPVVSLRFFNVYGPRQSLSNPYTGVTAIFISRLKNNKPPVVYEDGLQTRDFISVHDVVDALVKSIDSKQATGHAINISSGRAIAIKDVSSMLARLLHKNIKPQITGRFRKGDVRHCFADIRLAKRLLNWQPRVSLNQGFFELIKWSEKEESVDLFDQAEKELRDKSLV